MSPRRMLLSPRAIHRPAACLPTVPTLARLHQGRTMSSIMNRSFADRMGFNWPKHIACVVSNHRLYKTYVTFDQLLEERKQKQRRHLAELLAVNPKRQAAFLWTFYQPGLFGFAYMGWWAYIRTLNKDWKLDEPREWELHGNFTLDLMRQFPCGLLPLPENFELWKEAFGETYSRPGRFEKQGLALGWVECGS